MDIGKQERVIVVAPPVEAPEPVPVEEPTSPASQAGSGGSNRSSTAS
jgi:hypothetical protein